MPNTPFRIFALRFERTVAGRTVIADLQPPTLPSVPGADWDEPRDVTMSFEKPTSYVAVISGASRRLVVQARFQDLPPVQSWTIWAEDETPGAVLPRVDPQEFKELVPGCVSRELTFTADAGRLAAAGVGRFEVTWSWRGQFTHPDGRTDPVANLGVTRFVVLAVLDCATAAPWRQIASTCVDRDLVRPGILEIACRAASGSANPLDAATAVTRAFFDLGSEARRRSGLRPFVYGDTDDFACDTEHHVFLCERLMEAILERAGRRPVGVSCEDLATAVCVFGNALGLDLERRIIRIPRESLILNTVKRIGLAPSASVVWDNHIVAWSPSLDGVFDACVQLNLAGVTGQERWETPAGMPFGDADDHPRTPGYRHRLLRQHAGACTFTRLHDPTLDRAAARPVDARGPFAERQAELIQRLPEVKVARRLGSLSFPVSADALLAPPGFVYLAAESTARDKWFSLVWESHADAGPRVRLTAEWTPDLASAIELAAWRLTFYREPMTPAEDPAFPHTVYFASGNGERVLVVYENAVVRLRSDGEVPFSPTPVFGPVLGPVLVPPAPV